MTIETLQNDYYASNGYGNVVEWFGMSHVAVVLYGFQFYALWFMIFYSLCFKSVFGNIMEI